MSDELKENFSQEAPHSPGDFSASESPLAHWSNQTDAMPQTTEPTKEQINWPKMSNNTKWASLDDDLDRVLQVT